MSEQGPMADTWHIPPCNDQVCTQRTSCMIWGEPDDPKWGGFSLFPFDLPIDQPCPFFADREAA